MTVQFSRSFDVKTDIGVEHPDARVSSSGPSYRTWPPT